MLVAAGLFIRMGVQVNGALPRERRIPLIEIRSHLLEIRELHAALFPSSALRRTFYLMLGAAISTITAGAIWEVGQ
jgi:hypothetical protein